MQPVTTTVEVELKTKAKEQDTVTQEVLGNEASTEPMMLEVELGLTKALRKYESARITVRLSRPTTEASLEEDYDRTKAWIENKIAQEVDSINKALKQMDAEVPDFDI